MELLRLVSDNDVDGVKAMLTGVCDVDVCDERGQSALYVACEKGYGELINLLLEHGASATFAPEMLFAASANGHKECVRMLLTHKRADIVNLCFYKRQNSIEMALENQHWSIVELLLDFGALIPEADINRPDFWKPTSPEHSSLILKLIKSGLKPPLRDNRYLQYALKYGPESLAMLLLQADIPQLAECQTMMLHYGAKRNFCKLIRFLIIDRKVSLNKEFAGKTPLYVACMDGNVSAAALLLQNGADPNVRIFNGWPYAIQVAASKGHKDIVELLLRNNATDKNQTSSLVHQSFDAGAGHMEIVKLLVDCGCNLDVRDDNGKTILSKAAERCLGSEIEELVNFGADVNSKSCRQGTPLHLLLSRYTLINRFRVCDLPSSELPDGSEIVNAVDALVEKGANCDNVSPLYLACKADLVPVVDRLLKRGCDVNAGEGDKYPLLAALENSNKVIVERLLAEGATVNRQQEKSQASSPNAVRVAQTMHALSVCVKRGSPSIAELLIEHGADVDFKDHQGNRPIDIVMDCLLKEPAHKREGFKETMLLLLKSKAIIETDRGKTSLLYEACSRELLDIAEMLLKHGADPNEKTRTASGYSTPLRAACVRNNERLVELLLSYKVRLEEPTTADNDDVDKFGLVIRKVDDEPLLHKSAAKDNVRITAMLLELGANVNVVNSRNQTALHLTSSPDVVSLLLHNGADANVESDSKETPLYVACKRGQTDIITMLLKSGADVNRNSVKNPLCYALREEKWQIFELLFSYNAKCNTDKQLNSALCLACRNGNKVIVDKLVKRGADVNTVDKSKNAPLIAVIEYLSTIDVDPPNDKTQAHLDIIDNLLSNGAATNATAGNGDTPLIIAVEKALHSVVCKLIDHGADINLMGAVHYPITAALSRCLTVGKLRPFGSRESSAERQHERLLKIVELFMSRKVKLNVVSKRGQSPLYLAIRNEMYDTVEAMIEAGANINLAEANQYRLVIACSRGLHDLAKSLLDAGVEPNVLDHADKTPLLVALGKVDEDMVRLLLTHKANVNMANRGGNTPLHYLMKTKHDPCIRDHVSNLVNTLLLADACVNKMNSDGETPLYVACVENSDDLFLIEMLLKRGADANIQLEPKRSAFSSFDDSYNSKLPLVAAVAKCDQRLLKLLLSYGANVNRHGTSVVHTLVENYIETQPSHRGKSPLAFSHGEESVDVAFESRLRLTLDAGADVNAVNKNGETALYKACEKNAKAVVRVLLEYGADVNITTTKNAEFPITAAFRTDDVDLVELLLSKGSKANVSLASAGAVGADASRDRTIDSRPTCVPLSEAVRIGNCKMVEVLLSHGTDVSTVNQALVAACRDRNEDIVALLLSHGADPNEGTRTPGEICLHDGKPFELPLTIAAETRNVNLVQRLLASGANANAADGNGRTALHYVTAKLYVAKLHDNPRKSNMLLRSVEFGDRDAVITQLLLEAGAEADHMDPEVNYRPLQMMLAPIINPCFNPYREITRAKYARLDIVEALIAHGAIMDLSDRNAGKCRRWAARLDDFIRIGERECEWLVKLFKAGAPHEFLSACSVGVRGRKARCCPRLGQAVVLNGLQPRLDEELLVEMRQSNCSSVRDFVSWLEQDMKLPPSLRRRCRVVIRKQLYVASGSRTIVPLIGRLLLPSHLMQYIGFEGNLSEVDLTPASSSDEKEIEESSDCDNDDDIADEFYSSGDDYYDNDHFH